MPWCINTLQLWITLPITTLTGRLQGFPLTFTHRLGGKWSSCGQLVSDRQNLSWTWTEKSHLVPEMSLQNNTEAPLAVARDRPVCRRLLVFLSSRCVCVCVCVCGSIVLCDCQRGLNSFMICHNLRWSLRRPFGINQCGFWMIVDYCVCRLLIAIKSIGIPDCCCSNQSFSPASITWLCVRLL